MLSINNDNDGYYYINDNIIFEKGCIYGILINIDKKEIFHLNENEKIILELIKKRYSYSTIINKLNIEPDIIRKYLNIFHNNNIIFKSNKKIYIDRINLRLAIDYFNIISKNIIKIRELIIKYPGSCLLNCSLCTDPKYLYCGCKKNKVNENISLKLLESAIKDIKIFGCNSICIIGGDPLLNENINKTIETLRLNNINNIKIITNLYGFNSKILEVIKSAGIHITVPLFSANSEQHDKITQIKGSFHQTLSNIRKLIKNNVLVSVFLYSDIKEKQSDERNLEKLNNLGILEIRNDKYIYKSNQKSDEIFYKKNIDKVLEPLPHDNIYINKAINICSFQKIIIDYKGNIFPCQGATTPIGNIKKISIRKLLRHGKMEKYWYRRNNHLKCKKCEYDLLCTNCYKYISKNNKKKNSYCQYDPEKRNMYSRHGNLRNTKIVEL